MSTEINGVVNKEESKGVHMFVIGDKEYELKLTYESVKYLSGLYEGGAMGVIGEALKGDLDTFEQIVHAGLFHAKERYTLKAIQKAIAVGFDKGLIDLNYVLKTGKAVVVDSFFFKTTVEKVLKDDPEALKALENLID